MSPTKAPLEILKFQDGASWTSHYIKYQHVLHDIKIKDISVKNSAIYAHSKIISKTPEDLTSLSCFNQESIAKAELIKDFSVSTDDLMSSLQTKYYVKKKYYQFYKTEVFEPSMHVDAETNIRRLYQEFSTISSDKVLSEIGNIVVYLSKNLGNATCCLIEQIHALSYVNEVFVGLIFMPHILSYVGFVRFWSYVFPFFLQVEGNVQYFLHELKDKFYLAENRMPRHLSPITFLTQNKWSFIACVGLSSFFYYHGAPMLSFIEPMFNSTYKIFYQAKSMCSFFEPMFNPTYKAVFKKLPWYAKFLQHIDLSINLDIKVKSK